MAEISQFFGIVIRMFFSDHDPPYSHAAYGNDEATSKGPEPDTQLASLARSLNTGRLTPEGEPPVQCPDDNSTLLERGDLGLR